MGLFQLILAVFVVFTFSQILVVVSGNPPLNSFWDSNYGGLREIRENEKILENSAPRLTKVRLPNDVIPLNYKLEIQPLLDESSYGKIFTMNGWVTITVTSFVETNLITLHSLTDINQSTVRVMNGSGTDIPITSQEIDLENEFHIIHLAENLVVGLVYDIYIEYVANLPQHDEYRGGIYVNYYLDPENGEKRYLVGSQMEPTDFRRSCPSFDEPSLKATFEVTILRKLDQISLTNMEKISEEEIPQMQGWFRDHFEKSVILPTYLTCFSVSDYTSETSVVDPKYSVKVFGPPHIIQVGGAKYSVEFIQSLLKHFDNYFGINYTLPHLNNAAFPQFGGAMENHGLNAYSWDILLWIEGESTYQTKVAMSSTMSHEVVHAWFGNLVSLAWWDDLWLNEGFAAYYTQKGASGVDPKLYTVEQMLNSMVQIALQADMRINRSISSPVETPDEINSMFDTITYQKGGSVVRMVDQFMGEQNFLDGLRDYLNKKWFGNAESDDLFSSLELFKGDTTNGIEIKAILDTWIRQDGFPLVRATRNFETGLMTFTQEKYTPDADIPDEEGTKWYIPLFHTQENGNPEPSVLWFPADAESTEMTIPDDKWILINPSQFGFFRTLYDDQSLSLISEQLKADHEVFYLQSRSMLVDDVINLAYSKHLSLSTALDFLTFMKNERDLIPWGTLLVNFQYTNRMFVRSSTFVHFRTFMRNLIGDAMTELTYENDPSNGEMDKILLRYRLADWACNLGIEGCITYSKESMENWMQSPQTPSVVFPDMQAMVYCHAVAHGDDSVWDFVFNQYKTFDRALVPEQMRLNLLRSLGCPKESYRLTKILSMVLDPNSDIRAEHKVQAIQSIAANSNGADLTFSFIKNNFDDLIRRYGATLFASTISTLSNYFNTEIEFLDVEKFIQDKSVEFGPVQGSLQTSLNNIRANINWMTNHHDEFKTWLINNQ